MLWGLCTFLRCFGGFVSPSSKRILPSFTLVAIWCSQATGFWIHSFKESTKLLLSIRSSLSNKALTLLRFLFGLHTDTEQICIYVYTYAVWCMFLCVFVCHYCLWLYNIIVKKIPSSNLLFKKFIFLFEGEKGADLAISWRSFSRIGRVYDA